MWKAVEDEANKARMAKAEREIIKKKKMQREENSEFIKPTIEREIKIAMMVEEKQEKEENLIEIRTVEEMVPRRFHKYLKMFEKKESERMVIRKTWDHTIDLREGFVPKKGKICLLSRIEREKV